MNTKIQLRLATLLAVFLLSAGTAVAQPQCQPPTGQPCNGRCIAETSICILEPVPGGVDEIPSSAIGLQAFFYYINNGVWNWAFGLGVAVAVQMGVIGGFQIVLSNGDTGKVDAGKKKFIGSAIGLIILLLSGVILNFLNPWAFST